MSVAGQASTRLNVFIDGQLENSTDSELEGSGLCPAIVLDLCRLVAFGQMEM